MRENRTSSVKTGVKTGDSLIYRKPVLSVVLSWQAWRVELYTG